MSDEVFLSHSAKDKAVVRGVAERLRKGGLRAPGENGNGENIHRRPDGPTEKAPDSE